MIAVCALLVAASLSDVPAPAADNRPEVQRGTTGPIAHAVAATAVPPAHTASSAEWKPVRPAALTLLYGTFGALQMLDVYSTRRALRDGSREVNPLLQKAAGSSGALIVAKAISTATSIYFTERAWKKHRKGAVILMSAINGVTAAVVARNLRNAR